MASTCSGLELGLASQPEMRPVTAVKASDLATRPLVGEQRPWSFSFAEKNFHKDKRREASKVFIKRKKSTVHVDRHTGRLDGQSLRCALMQFKITYMGHSPSFPLANHFYLLVTSIFGIFQDLSKFAQASLS